MRIKNNSHFAGQENIYTEPLPSRDKSAAYTVTQDENL